MLIVAKELIYAVKALFTTTRDRYILLGLVLIAAMISVSELAVAKLFTKIIGFEKTMSSTPKRGTFSSASIRSDSSIMPSRLQALMSLPQRRTGAGLWPLS